VIGKQWPFGTGNQTVPVLDGDTLEVLHNQRPERIRLSGIDCPEKGQAFGKRAKQAASGLGFGKEVTLQTHGLDKYGRTLADVLLPDGTHVGQRRLVLVGWRRKREKSCPAPIDLSNLGPNDDAMRIIPAVTFATEVNNCSSVLVGKQASATS